MSLIIWTVLVGIVGWGTARAMRNEASSAHHVMQAAICISGALLGGWLMAMPNQRGMVQTDEVSILSLLVSFFIALGLSMIANLWDRVSAQDDAELDF
jgi:uncharacterized membrane protein YeaQ/YmgE (transglycosylase-associated protein family)